MCETSILGSERRRTRQSSFLKTMPIVKEWKASYYQNSYSKWLHGTLEIYPAFVRFIEQYSRDSRGKSIDFRIYFDEFTEIKREKTTIFYAAITIRIKAEKYWFSSFPSCTEVYNVIEHFWRERLIDRLVKIFVEDNYRHSDSGF